MIRMLTLKLFVYVFRREIDKSNNSTLLWSFLQQLKYKVNQGA